MENEIDTFSPGYDWEKDFEELPKDIDNVNFLMECRYEYGDYHIKLTRRFGEKEYNIDEELYVNREEEECQDLLKQLEEINIDELPMNVEFRASNAPRNNNNQGSSSNSRSTSCPIIFEILP